MFQIFGIGTLIVGAFILLWIWNSINIIKEWERGVVLRLGRLLPEAKGAGLRLVFWPIEVLYKVSLRLETLDVPPQDIITRDNVSVKVNAVCYFRVVDANLALSQVQNYQYATSQLAQTTLRSVVGQFELDEILSQRTFQNRCSAPSPSKRKPNANAGLRSSTLKVNSKPPPSSPMPPKCWRRSPPPSSCATSKP
jgi:regulator of protease activity HflC (stomatin/prohibitin superfamily)